jgi:hypothetical protein
MLDPKKDVATLSSANNESKGCGNNNFEGKNRMKIFSNLTVSTKFLAVELRYMTCIEMIQYKSFYIDQHRHDGLTLVSGTYDEELNSCSINFTNCSALVSSVCFTVSDVSL